MYALTILVDSLKPSFQKDNVSEYHELCKILILSHYLQH